MARQLVAGTEPLRQRLKNAPQLRAFILSDVRSTGKELGKGSYGNVEELEKDGLICAGKKLFDALIDPVNQGAQQMVEKYYNECSLLSNLRHPNVVQFLGICFLPETRLPVLVMERLDGSLDKLLESTPDIPLHVKVSILQDVTRGLVYLHNHKPPIIHRDLTARNVLLTPAMTAKVADLGNSRKLAKSMTRGIPGTLVYMPPEASDESNKYGTSLDMFSFGHLSLFTAIQEFPEDLLPPNYRDPKTKKLTARSELERRGVYIEKLHKILDPKHDLVILIKCCLEYDAHKRPTARQALDRLVAVKDSIPPTPYSELNKLQFEMALKQKEAELKVEQENISVYQQCITDLQKQLDMTQKECGANAQEFQNLNWNLDQKVREIKAFQAKLAEFEEKNMAAKKELIERESEGTRMKEYLSYLKQEVDTKMFELEQEKKQRKELSMQLQKEKLELRERMEANSQEQKVALQVALEQAMENEKSRHEREHADMAAAHKQEIESKQAEMETLQKKLIEKEALEHKLEQQMSVESSETEIQHQKHREQLLPQRSVSKERYELPSHYQKYKDQAERIHLLTKKVGELLATATHLKSEHAKLKEDNELLKLEAGQYKQGFEEERKDRERAERSLEEARNKIAEGEGLNEEFGVEDVDLYR